MSKISEKAQEFVNKLEEIVKKKDSDVTIQAELQAFGGLFVKFIKDNEIIDSYTIQEDTSSYMNFIRTWNGVL